MNSYRLIVLQAFILIFVAIEVVSKADAELYRYLNDDGAVVIGSSVPPELTRNGYAIMSSDGSKVLEVVPRALTQEELEVRQQKEEKNLGLAAQREKQKKVDTILLRLYSGPEDVLYARGIKLKDLDRRIESRQSRMVVLQERRQKLIADAVEKERAGVKISDEYLGLLSAVDNRIAAAKLELENLEKEKVQLIISYQESYDRVKELTNPEKNDPASVRVDSNIQ